MRVLTAIVSTIAFAATLPAAQRQMSNTLDIYVIDVEGGNAQLWVTPSGESVVYDTGNGGAAAARDADRIMAAIRDAGVTQIDYVITTHFHGDHVGGLPELATRIPIKEFIDHGPNVQPGPQIDRVLEQYRALYSMARRTIVKTGDRIPIKGLEWRIVSSAAQMLKMPLSGAGAPNPHCAGFRPHGVNPVSGGPLGKTEDEQSVGSHVTFGRFRVLYLGDFDWNQEFELMCPINRIGTVDLFIPSRHGQFSSNSETLVHPLRARVMIMNNGLRKGGQPEAMKVFLNSPGLENLWQIHFAFLGGQEHNVPGMYIANLDETTVPVTPMVPATPGTPAATAPQHDGPAHWIKVSARMDGSFSVTNSRNGLVKSYSTGT